MLNLCAAYRTQAAARSELLSRWQEPLGWMETVVNCLCVQNLEGCGTARCCTGCQRAWNGGDDGVLGFRSTWK